MTQNRVLKVSISKVDVRRYPRYRHSPWKLDWRTADGRRHRHFFAKRDQALTAQARLHQELNLPALANRGERVGFAAAVEQYLSEVEGAANTRYQYRTILLRFGSVTDWPDSGHWTGQLVRDYVRHRAARDDVSPATVNKELRTLKAFFNWARKPAGLIEETPFEQLPIHKRQLRECRPEPQTWTPEQFQAVLDKCPTAEWRLFAHLLVNGVGRHQDVAHLTADQVDFEREAVRIVETKTGKAKLAPLHPVTAELLRRYLAGRTTGRLFQQHSFRSQSWRLYCERAKVPYVKMHHLRICLSNWLQDQGVAAEAVSRILNHSTPSVTLNWYTTNRVRDARFRAVEQLPLSAGLPQKSGGEGDPEAPDMFDAPLI